MSGLAVQVAHVLSADNPAWAPPGEIDWDAVLEFLEKLIELLLKVLPLFL